MSTRVPITFKDGIHAKLVAQAKLKERTLSEHVNILLDDVFSGKLVPPQLASSRPSPQFAPAPAHHADLPLMESKHKDRKKHPPREWQGSLWEFGSWGYSQSLKVERPEYASRPRGWFINSDGVCEFWCGVDATYEERLPTEEEDNNDPVTIAQRAAHSVEEPLPPLYELVEEDPDLPTVAPKRGDGDFLLD